MTATFTIRGRLVRGRGEATGFTRLDWVREAFLGAFAIDPYPGTVNLELEEPAQHARWSEVLAWPPVVIRPPDPSWCDAWCYPARIEGAIAAAIVRPAVDDYPADQVELVAPIGVRDALGLEDGAPLQITVSRPTGV